MRLFTRLNKSMNQLIAYHRTKAELEALPLETRLDLDIYKGDIPQIAAHAVYGREAVPSLEVSAALTGAGTNGVTSPPNRAISLTSLDAMAWWRASAIKNTVSIWLFSTRFMPTI